jgi:hypothetical protein
MTDLIKRLEEAEEGCPFLDREIWVALEFYRRSSPPAAPEYTTSIDAALALAERVLPGCLWTAGSNTYDGAPNGQAEVFLPVPSDFHDGCGEVTAATPTLALCIAILKATDTGRE